MAINTDGAMIGKAGIQIYSKSEYKRVTTLMQDEIERLRAENERLQRERDAYSAVTLGVRMECGPEFAKSIDGVLLGYGIDLATGNVATTDKEGSDGKANMPAFLET